MSRSSARSRATASLSRCADRSVSLFVPSLIPQTSPSESPDSGASRRTPQRLFSPVNPLSAPVRDYQFILASARGQVGVVSDNRPWLGAGVSAVDSSSASSPMELRGTVSGSPAAGVLQLGDVIVSVDGQRVPGGDRYALGPAMIDHLEKLHAGLITVP